MIADIRTVMWKEFKEIIYMRGSKRGTLLAMFVPAFVLGVLFPLQLGSLWIETPFSLITWIIVPFILISSIIADSFAGERERHTLETLLSTRLSEKAILLGKICAAMLYSLSITVIIVFLSLVTVSIADGEGRFLLFSPIIGISGVTTGILMASIAANAGTLVSLRATTVRQAQQTLGLALFVIFFSPSIIIQFVPKSYLENLREYFSAFDLTLLIIAVAAFFIFVDIVLFMWTLARFKRSMMLFH